MRAVMKAIETSLPGVLIIEPRVFADDRGFFMETYHAAKLLATAGIDAPFVQDNHSGSTAGVLRGLHYQEPTAQGKLVRAVSGSIFDVAVDIRRGSPHFRRWVGVELSAENRRQLWVPPGFAHGFCVLTDWADVLYKCTTLYEGENDRGIIWNDPEIGIDWPVAEPVLSAKDAALPLLRDSEVLPPYAG
jgi:dTDP-4-dehydrorhamnose 3,5-epimerase